MPARITRSFAFYSSIASRIAIVILISAFASTSLAATNLVSNPGFEQGAGNQPTDWSQGHWGTNTATFTYPAIGVGGSKAGSVAITNYISGDAKWFFKDFPVIEGHQYLFYDSYKSTAPTICNRPIQNGVRHARL